MSPCSSSDTTTPGATADEFTFAQAFDFSSLRAQEPSAAGPQDNDLVRSRSSSDDASPSMRRLMVRMEGGGAVVLCRRSPSPSPSRPAVDSDATAFAVEKEVSAVAARFSPASLLHQRLQQLPPPPDNGAVNDEAQRDEICALRSILGRDVLDSGSNYVCWSLRAPLPSQQRAPAAVGSQYAARAPARRYYHRHSPPLLPLLSPPAVFLRQSVANA